MRKGTRIVEVVPGFCEVGLGYEFTGHKKGDDERKLGSKSSSFGAPFLSVISR